MLLYYIQIFFFSYYSTFLAFWIFISILFFCMKALNKKKEHNIMKLNSCISFRKHHIWQLPSEMDQKYLDEHISQLNEMIASTLVAYRIPNFSK